MPDLSAACYSINAAVRLHWAELGDEHVVFEETSGQTHQLDAVRAFVLNLLLDQALGLKDIQAELISAIPSSGNQYIAEIANDVLCEFVAHGLVEVTV